MQDISDVGTIPRSEMSRDARYDVYTDNHNLLYNLIIHQSFLITMPFRNFITEDCICIDVSSRSKTAVLLKVSQLLCRRQPTLDLDTLFDAYWKRESLGSTAIGHGILIPHIRSNATHTITGCLIKLQNPVDFGAEDKQPVDLVVGLVAGVEQADEHLQVLAKITQQFSSATFRRACRKATTQNDLCKLFIQSHQYSPDLAAASI